MRVHTSRHAASGPMTRKVWLTVSAVCLVVAGMFSLLYRVHGAPAGATPVGHVAPVGIYAPSHTGSLSVTTDRRPAELGVRFRVPTAGLIVGVRFYKSARNTGVHIGSLWSGAGSKLATATFRHEAPTGWQAVRFSHPVAVRAGVAYVASYHTNVGYYAERQGFGSSGSSLIQPLDGVYHYGTSTFPSSQYKRSTYFVDPLFERGRRTHPTQTPSTAGPTTAAPTSSAPPPVSSAPPRHSAPPPPSSTAPSSSAPAPSSGGKPGPTNTGVPAGTKLTVVDGDQSFHTAGQVISGLDIHGYVTVDAPNVVIKDSIIRGGVTTTTPAAVVSVNGGSLTMEDSEINPSNPDTWLDGIWAENTTLTSVNIHGAVDGVKAFDNVTIQDSYIHDLSWYASQPSDPGPTHNDAVQTYEGSRNITLWHNNMDPGKNGNSAYQVTQDLGKVATDLHIEDNWLDGGNCTLNFSQKGGPTPMTGIYVTDNRFGHGSTFNCPILIGTKTVLSADSGNVWDDTGQPIPEPQQHD